MIPFAEINGGETHETLMVCDVSVVQVVSCGGCSGIPSAVYCLVSLDNGPGPNLLNACTTTEY